MRSSIFHQFKIGHTASQTAANINGTLGEIASSDWTVRYWFLKYQRMEAYPEVLCDRQRVYATDNQHL